MRLPDPHERPLLRPAELIGLHPDLKRSAIYDAIKRNEIPSVKIGARVYIPTAGLLRLLQLDETAAVAGDPVAL